MSLPKVTAKVLERGLFWPMIGLIVVTAVFYIYSVNRTVMLVAQRNTVQTQINSSRAEITNLEKSYMGETSKITLSVAGALGYGEASKTIYIPKKAVSVLTGSETIQ